MAVGDLTPERPRVRLRRTARAIWRELGPVVGIGLPGLLRHPVWTTSAADGVGLGVVVVPGFGGVDASMAVLRRWLRRRGYAPIGAQLGMNIGCTGDMVGRLERRVEQHTLLTGGPVVLLGHSRGGWIARMVAIRRPDLVRGLVMLGSPVLDPLDVRGVATFVIRVLLRLSRSGVRGVIDADCLDGACREATAAGLGAALLVPALAIYSRDDGVVGWQSCRDPHAEWVEVLSSHTGMGTDPHLYSELVPRLAGWAAARRSTDAA